MPAAYRDARMAICTGCHRLMPLEPNADIMVWHFQPGAGRHLCAGSQMPPAPKDEP